MSLLMSIRHNKTYLALIFFVITASLLLSGCSGTSGELQAMLDSTLPTAQLSTASEVYRSYNDHGTGLLGKPSFPKVLLQYKPLANYTTMDVLKEIEALLVKDNWKVGEINEHPEPFFDATLPQNGFNIEANVNNSTTDNLVTVRLQTTPQ